MPVAEAAARMALTRRAVRRTAAPVAAATAPRKQGRWSAAMGRMASVVAAAVVPRLAAAYVLPTKKARKSCTGLCDDHMST